MSHATRQTIGITGLLVLLMLAGAPYWLPELSRQKVVVKFDATPAMSSAPSQPASAIAAVPPPSNQVEIYDLKAISRPVEKAPAAVPLPKTKPVAEAKVAVPEERPKPKAEPPPQKVEQAAKPQVQPQPQQQAQPQPQPKPAEPEQRVQERQAPSAPPVAAGLKPGRFPPLVVEFQSLGIERYVAITEQVGGAFFAYLGGEGAGGRLTLGPRKSEPLGIVGNDLATERPYLVSDQAIRDLLRDRELPPQASRTALVMLWPRWLDAKAWDAVEAALRESNIDGDNVIQVDAAVKETGNRQELTIEAFRLQPDGRKYRLGNPKLIRIAR